MDGIKLMNLIARYNYWFRRCNFDLFELNELYSLEKSKFVLFLKRRLKWIFINTNFGAIGILSPKNSSLCYFMPQGLMY